MVSRKEALAVFASVAVLGAVVGLVFLTGQTVRGQLLPLQPWFLTENATFTWEHHSEGYGDEPQESLVTFRVKEVADWIVLHWEGSGRTLNQTWPQEYIEEWYTTLAAHITYRGTRLRNVTYQAEFTRYDVGGHSFAALHESGSYESIGLGWHVDERITDLTTFATLFWNRSLRVDGPGGHPPSWVNDTRWLTSFQGIEPTAVASMNVFEVQIGNGSTLVHSFNAPNLFIDARGSAVNVAFMSAQEALIASLIDTRTTPVLDVTPGNASQSLVPINETHSLLRVRTSPGSFRFTLTLGQEQDIVEVRTLLSLSPADALTRSGSRGSRAN